MSKHTKGPWLDHEGHIMAPGGQTVAIVDGAARSFPGLRFQDQMAIDEANASYIVRCVNAHEALVAAAKIALQCVARAEVEGAFRDCAAPNIGKSCMSQLEHALALARGKQS